MNNILLVGSCVRPMAKSAHRAHVTTVGADLFCDWDTQQYCQAHRLRDYSDVQQLLNRESFDGVVYGGPLENRLDLLQLFEETSTILGCGRSAVAQVRDPIRLAEQLRREGFPTPRVSELPPNDGDTWVRKSVNSSGGAGVVAIRGGVRVFAEATVQTGPQCQKAIGADGPIDDRDPPETFWQEYVAGESVSVSYFASEQRCRVLGASLQLLRTTATSSFSYVGSIAPLDLGQRYMQVAQQIGTWLTIECNLRGWFGVDFVRNEDGLWPIEVNPRFTASMELLERAGRRPWFPKQLQRDWTATCDFGQDSGGQIYGKQIVFNQSEQSLIIGDSDFQWLLARWRVDAVTDVPVCGSVIEPGRPICSVWSVGPTVDSVLRVLGHRQRTVETRCCGTDCRHLSQKDA